MSTTSTSTGPAGPAEPTASTGLPVARRRAGVLLIATMAAIAAAQWHVVFGWSATVPLVLAALAAGGVALVAGSPRRSLAATGVPSVVALVAVLVALGRDDATPAGLLDGLLHGWSRILSTTLEVPVTEGRILLPAVVVWLAGFAGAELALRLITWPAAAVVPPLVAYGVALPFGAGGGSPVPAAGLLVVGLATVHVLSKPTVPDVVGVAADADAAAGFAGVAGEGPSARAWRARAARPLRAVGAVGFVGLSATAGLVAGVQLPFFDTGHPYDPRADQEPPLDDVATIDPLSLLAGWALDPDDPVLFTADGPAADRWRLAVLDRYDPAAGWSSQAGYVALGSRVPAPEVPDTMAVAGPSAERTVTVGALDGVWLPTTGRPVALTGVEGHVDRATGMLVHGGGLVAGLRYRLTSEPARVTGDCSEAGDRVAPPPSGDDAWMAADLMAYATAVTQGATSMCAQAELIESYLRSDRFAFDPDAPSGATLARTLGLLEPGDDPDDPQVGTSEQFATAFALLARAAGMDARVAVGFRPGEPVGGAQRVHASDAYAWAEVRFDRLGWVAFDPTPGSGDDEERPESPAPPVTASPSTTATTATTAPTSTTIPTSTTTVGEAGACGDRSCGERSRLGLAVVAVTGGLALVAGMVVAIALVRRRRRAARRGGGAAVDRVVGAWRQCLVDLRDGGLPLPTANTVSDYVEDTRRTLGPHLGDELGPVAVLANRALFSGQASEDDATHAWRSADQLTATLAAGRSQGARLRRALDVRALVRS